MSALTDRAVELIELLRFRRLDARNGSIAGDEAAVRLCCDAAEVIEQLLRQKAETKGKNTRRSAT